MIEFIADDGWDISSKRRYKVRCSGQTMDCRDVYQMTKGAYMHVKDKDKFCRNCTDIFRVLNTEKKKRVEKKKAGQNLNEMFTMKW